jgi:hypothetical protein
MSEKRSKSKNLVLINFEIPQGESNETDPEKGRLFLHNLDGADLQSGTKCVVEIDKGGHGIYFRETVARCEKSAKDVWEVAELIGCTPYVPEIVYELDFCLEKGDEKGTIQIDNDSGRIYVNNRTKRKLKPGTKVEIKKAGDHGIEVFESTITAGKVVKAEDAFFLVKEAKAHPRPKPNGIGTTLFAALDEPIRYKQKKLSISHRSPSTHAMMAMASIDVQVEGSEGLLSNIYIISKEPLPKGDLAEYLSRLSKAEMKEYKAGKLQPSMPFYSNPRQVLEMTYVGHDVIEVRLSDAEEADLLIEDWQDLTDEFIARGVKFEAKKPFDPLKLKPQGNVTVIQGDRELEAASVN